MTSMLDAKATRPAVKRLRRIMRTPPSAGAELFDEYFRETTVDRLRALADRSERAYMAADADAVEKLLIAPLYDWIEHHRKDGKRSVEIIAADTLIDCAQLSIAYGFTYRQHVSPQTIDKLDQLWQEFQRLAALAVVADQDRQRIEARERNSTNAKGRHKPAVTGPAIRAFKVKHEYDKGTAYGWIAAAAKHFNVDRNTIKAHENDE